MNDELRNIEGSTNSAVVIPFIVAIGGSIIGIAASFIKYISASNVIFSWKTSIVQMIIETIDKPELNLPGVGDIIVFGIICAGVVFSLLVLLFVLLKKMKAALVFSMLACLPFLVLGTAWIHYIGFTVTIVGAIWYMIAKKHFSA